MNATVDMNSAEGLARLSRLYRYAQVGRCVSSVTHDVNNFLGAIMAYSELIGMDQNISPESKRMLQEIVNGVSRCSNLINNLTSVARKERTETMMLPLATIVEKVVDLRRYDMKAARIKCDLDIQADMSCGAYDRAKLEQALIYIVTNAIEAVALLPRREIKITTYATDDSFEVSIWDSGPVIDESLRDHLFDPFFSTKDEDHVGLGLYSARETALLHGGSLEYEPDRGFVLTLPKHRRAPDID